MDEQETNLTRLREDLEDVKKAAAEAEGLFYCALLINWPKLTLALAEAQKKASQAGIALSEESLAEYHSLCANYRLSDSRERKLIIHGTL